MNKTLMNVPLQQLQRANDNVRRIDTGTEIEALAASIAAHGLLQNLTVRRLSANGNDRRYEVLAGGRRLQALKLLVKRKKLPKDYIVPCRLADEKMAGGMELSLAENVMRVALHPADQFDAFSQLQSQGLAASEIAVRFGVSERSVEQRLKLAAVSPRLMAEYKAGNLTLDQLTAFAVTDDHALQEHTWFEAPLFDRSASAIRRALTKSLVDGSDRRARFVGVKNYEVAGGTVVRDLFDEDAAYFNDSQLLDRLTANKLAEQAEDIKLEGWSWVECHAELDYEALARFGKVFPKQIALSKKDAKRFATLSKRYDSLVAALEDRPSPEKSATLDRISDEIERLARKREHWPKTALTKAGVIVSLTSEGTLQVTRGLIRQQQVRGEVDADGAHSETSVEGRKSGYSEALLQDLSVHRTAALRETLADQPELALSALIYTFVMHLFFGATETCLDVRPTAIDLGRFADDIGEHPAVRAMAERHTRWAEYFPQPEAAWQWICKQTLGTKLELLAYLAACTIDGIRRPHTPGSNDRLSQADLLASACNLDMVRWWRPTTVSFFDRISKELVIEAVSEGVSSEVANNISGMKKAAMTSKAEELLSPTTWLPSPLRTVLPATKKVR
ncbi:MAG TPA: ParB/RepB/Spo0J family partition protein [Bryobacteraceae bacterium]|nr:ParB/RepB/Spo0J family partition protein [Bryobacteraceae bacterium]